MFTPIMIDDHIIFKSTLAFENQEIYIIQKIERERARARERKREREKKT